MVLAAGSPAPDNIDIFKAQSVAPAVVAALRAYDPNLMVWWDRAACRWSLMRVSRGGYHCVCILQRDGGAFRPLDGTLVDDVSRWDLWKHDRRADKNPGQQAADSFDQSDRDRHDKAEDDFKDDIHHLTLDNRRTLRRIGGMLGY